MASEPGRTCDTCGAALDAAQRYCLSCGARAGSRSPQLAELKRRAASEPQQKTPPADPPLPAGGQPPGAVPRLPRPRMAAVLVLVFLGFGVLLGSAAGSSPGRLAAAVGPRLKLVLPAATPGTSSNGKTTGGTAAEAPQSEPEATPEPAQAAASTPTKTASTKTSGEESKTESKSETEKPAKSETSADTPATKLPALAHVFLIVLDDEPYAAVFGPESKAHYVAGTLEKKGELLLRYDAVAHEQLANGIALVSGQGPTVQTAGNCATYSPLAPSGTGADGQVLGEGCVYPASTQTVGGQLTALKLKWRAYVQGIDEAGSAAGACAHPAAGAADPTFESGAYATFRDPFVYFESVTSSSGCASDVVGLSALKTDLASASSTPKPLLHRPRPLPRCLPGTVLRGGSGGSRRRGLGPGNCRARDHGLEGLQGGRADRDHQR